MTRRARITVVGLGPAGPDLVTRAALDAIDRVAPAARFLRTARHPAASLLAGTTTFDDAYESEPTFDAVYRRIADVLLAATGDHAEVLYAVPGSPRVLERTVELLVAEATAAGVEVDVVPALSFVDLAWVRLGVDPFAEGVRLVDGHRFAEAAAGQRGPLLIAHCHNRRVLSDVKLAFEHEAPEGAVLLQRLGLPDEAMVAAAWADLDRTVEPDHLTSVYVPVAASPVAAEVVRIDELVQRLRHDCPWDRDQTHVSLTRYLLEEAHEVLEAIGGLDGPVPDPAGEPYAHLEEELGDLLFQVVLHSAIAREAGAFTLSDVARGIHDKLVARHPHVFGATADPSLSAADVAAGWEARKRAEKGRVSVFDGIPATLPALHYAHKVLRKARAIGAEPAVVDPETDLAALDLDGLDATAVGDLLLAVVAATAATGVDPEVALRAAADRVRAAAEP